MEQEELIRAKYAQLKNILGEKQKRLWAASEANCLGYGGISTVQRATGLSRQTIICSRKHQKMVAKNGLYSIPKGQKTNDHG